MLDGCVCAYNIALTAKSPAGVKRSDETKAKMSAAKQGKTSPLKGRPSEGTEAPRGNQSEVVCFRERVEALGKS